MFDESEDIGPKELDETKLLIKKASALLFVAGMNKKDSELIQLSNALSIVMACGDAKGDFLPLLTEALNKVATKIMNEADTNPALSKFRAFKVEKVEGKKTIDFETLKEDITNKIIEEHLNIDGLLDNTGVTTSTTKDD